MTSQESCYHPRLPWVYKPHAARRHDGTWHRAAPAQHWGKSQYSTKPGSISINQCLSNQQGYLGSLLAESPSFYTPTKWNPITSIDSYTTPNVLFPSVSILPPKWPEIQQFRNSACSDQIHKRHQDLSWVPFTPTCPGTVTHKSTVRRSKMGLDL